MFKILLKLKVINRLIFLFLTALLCSNISRAEVLPIKTYMSADGLLYESVRRIYQDSRGLMWFCTPIGVSRFDGYQFINYTINDGLSNPGITDIVEDNNGVYLLGSVDSGVYRFDSRFKDSESSKPKFEHYKINPDGADNVTSFFKDRNGRIFAATPSGLFLFNDDEKEQKFSRIELKIPSVDENSTGIYVVAEDSDGSLWIGHQFGLTRRLADDTNLHYQVQPNGAADAVRSIFVDAQNRLWIITDRRDLALFNPDPLKSINSDDTLKRQINFKPESVFSGNLEKGSGYLFKPEESPANGTFGMIRGMSDGKIWIATNGKGLVGFSENKFSLYTKSNGLCDDRINYLFEDSFGNLWIASSWGLMKLPHRGFVTYKTEDGLADTQIITVFEDKNEILYAVNQNWKINQFDGKRFVSAKPNLPDDVGSWRYHRVLLDSTGEWWIGTRKGLFRFPKVEKLEQLGTIQPFAVYTKQDGLPSDDIYNLFEDSRGDVWFSFWSDITGKLTRWERSTGKFYQYDAETAVPADCFPSYFREDSKGNVFIGCRTEKVIVYSQNRFISYSADNSIKDKTIHDIFVDDKDRLWVGMRAGGLRRIDNPLIENPEIISYTTADGISETHIQYITEDNFGKIYYVTARGMDRLDPETGKIKYFTTADGLAAAGTGKAIRDKNGTLWLATSRGVSKFTPDIERNFPAPQVFISRLRIAGKDIPLAALGETELSNLTLEPDQRQLQIDFYGLSLATGEALRYQYTLNGKDWNEPTVQRSVDLNLSPGDYSFQVRAVNSDRSFSLNPAKIPFTILRPFWQQWWFLVLIAVLVSLVVYAFYRNRLRRLVELEKVRTRIATDLHDDLGSSLSQIAILSEVVRQKVGADGTKEPLDLIAGTSREMVDSMSDIVWAINPKKDHLLDLTQRMHRFAGDLLDAQEIDYQFIVQENIKNVSLSADVRRETYLIFKECVNNLVKHSSATAAKFQVKTENNCLIIKIEDNGRGFDVSKKSNGDDYSYGGNGLINIKRRADNLDGSLKVESETALGTKITLRFPIAEKYRIPFFRKGKLKV